MLTISPLKACRNGRFMYRVSGPAELLAEYRALALSKTFIASGISQDGTLLFYSGQAFPEGTALVKGTGCYYVDTLARQAVLNTIAQPGVTALLDDADKAAIKQALGLTALLAQLQKSPNTPAPAPAPAQEEEDDEL
jgi:hypothetical protein